MRFPKGGFSWRNAEEGIMDKDNFYPHDLIETERLRLRPLRRHDLEDLYRLKTDPLTVKYTEQEVHRSRSETEAFISYINEGIQMQRWVYYVLADKESDRLLGTITLWNFNAGRDVAEVGYELMPELWGKGLMREAMEKILEIGFQKLLLKEIEAFTSARNMESLQLLHRFNFEFVKNVYDEEKGELTEFIILKLENNDLDQGKG